jgi:hypothetical protein
MGGSDAVDEEEDRHEQGDDFMQRRDSILKRQDQ